MEYVKRTAHHRHCPGVPPAEKWKYYTDRLQKELKRAFDSQPYWTKMDKAWTIMLYKQGIIKKKTAVKLLKAVGKGAVYGETAIKEAKLTGDQDIGSLIYLGRTLQEPMSRMQLREKIIDVLEVVLNLREVILKVAEKNLKTIMVGQTHLSHAQPTTYASYLASVYDGFTRGEEQLELAYKLTNRNTAGCGALAGTGWPVDRYLVTELLGFDELVEPVYDSEASQDHSLCILFAITNLMISASKSSMDMNIWGMEEIGVMKTDPAWCGCSSFMPQKCIQGSQFERTRIEAAEVIGETIKGIALSNGEPHQDMLPICQVWPAALRALCHTEKGLAIFAEMLKNVEPQKDVMLKYAEEGFSATPDLAVKLIKDKGIGPRRAHRICGTFVRIARERKIKAYETAGELLDEAARIVGEKPPRLTTREVREALDPEKFIQRHNNTGDPNPKETGRLIKIRYKQLIKDREKQKERVNKVKEAYKKLEDAIRETIYEC